ncbi:asparagine synthetase B family protein [Emticicia fontis]
MILGCTQDDTFLDFSKYTLIESEQFRLGCIVGNDVNIFRDSDRNLIFSAQGRIDNSKELQPFMGACCSGPEYIWKAFLTWGKNCPARLIGDWLFAAYNTLSGELFLARDQNGKCELLYRELNGDILFSSSIRPLIQTARELNHHFTLNLLASWNYKGSVRETIFKDVFRLSPGHTLTYKSGKIKIEQYWFPENVPLKYYSNLQDYSDELLEITQEAIRCRIPANLKVGCMLSGGFDSTTVTSLTAELLGNNPLLTFTHVPLYNKSYDSDPKSFGDESEHAKTVVESKSNIRSFLVNSANVSPIDGIEMFVRNFNSFIPNAGNAFWIMDIHQLAANMGIEILFSAGTGNVALSYRGLIDELPMKPGYKAFKRKIIKPLVRNLVEYSRFSNRLKTAFLNKSLIDSYHIKKDVLINRRSLHSVFKTSQEEILDLVYKNFKNRLINNDSILNIQKLDPTADIRIIEHTLAIPNHFFFNEKKEGRQVIRKMMAGRLPDKVLNEHRRGSQSSDIFLRFVSEIDRAESYAQRFEKNPAFCHFIDTNKLKKSIQLVRAHKLTNPLIINNILKSLTLGVFLEHNNF